MGNTNLNDQMPGGEFTQNTSPHKWNYDPVTGKPINGQTEYTYDNNVTDTNTKGNSGNSTDLCIASLSCFLIGNLMLFTPLAIIAGIVLIAGFVIGVIATEKYPDNKFAKILSGLFIIEIIIVIIIVLVIVNTCISCLNGGCAGMS